MGCKTQSGQALIELIMAILLVMGIFLFAFFAGDTLQAQNNSFRFHNKPSSLPHSTTRKSRGGQS